MTVERGVVDRRRAVGFLRVPQVREGEVTQEGLFLRGGRADVIGDFGDHGIVADPLTRLAFPPRTGNPLFQDRDFLGVQRPTVAGFPGFALALRHPFPVAIRELDHFEEEGFVRQSGGDVVRIRQEQSEVGGTGQLRILRPRPGAVALRAVAVQDPVDLGLQRLIQRQTTLRPGLRNARHRLRRFFHWGRSRRGSSGHGGRRCGCRGCGAQSNDPSFHHLDLFERQRCSVIGIARRPPAPRHPLPVVRRQGDPVKQRGGAGITLRHQIPINDFRQVDLLMQIRRLIRSVRVMAVVALFLEQLAERRLRGGRVALG